MQTFLRNLRHSGRTLAGNQAFTLVSILTLALGIGANTAIFSVVYAALLRPLPYARPWQLFTLGEARLQQGEVQGANTSYPDFVDWKTTVRSFQSLGAYSGDAFTLVAQGDPRNTFAAQVTPGFFSLLGVTLAQGRDFVQSDQQGDIPQAAILGYKLWQSELHGDPSIVGQTVHLDGKPVTVVGILPREFEFAPAGYAELWVPLHPGVDFRTRRSLRWLNSVGRLADGVSPEQALAEMKAVTSRLAAAYPRENGAIAIVMGSLRERIIGRVRPLLLTLLGVVGLVLLITCANVASLLMTRSIGRRKEFAVRAALVATRGNLLAQLLTESLLLSFIGAAVGLLAASIGVDFLVSAIPQAQLRSMPFLLDAGVKLPVLAFVCGVTVLTGILFGMAPGLAVSQLSLNHTLKEGARGGTSGAHVRLRNGLVIAEIALSLVLLAGAGLMLRSLQALLGQDPGYDLNRVLTFSVNLPDAAYPSDKEYPFNSPAATRFEHMFSERLRQSPGIVAVAASSGIPTNGGSGTIRFVEEGRPVATGHEDEANILTVTADYFATLRIPLQTGRTFTAQDDIDHPPVLVVSQAFARHYFPGEDALGKRVRFTFNAKEPFRQIVGVVRDSAQNDFAEPHPDVVYYPNDQGAATFLNYLVRTAGDPVASVPAIRALLRDMDSQLPLIQPESLAQVVGQSASVFLRRYPSYLIGSFAALALVLAMIGLVGLISYSVAQRSREIGIRMTLGARQTDVLGMVLRQCMVTTLSGIGIGIAAAAGLTQLLRTLLFGVTPGDWRTYAAVSVLLLLVALVACVAPARRAMAIDPMQALRQD